MKTYGHDILASQKELKDRPFSVPDGYFDAFRSEMPAKVLSPRTDIWRRYVPYMATAACLALLLSVGNLVSRNLNHADEFTQEDYILFSDNLISTSVYGNAEMEQTAEAELLDEDIIEYLIYIGVSPESIELSK